MEDTGTQPPAKIDTPAAPTDPPAAVPDDTSFKTEGFDTSASASTNTQTITWTASEFIAHSKSFSWYAGLAAASLVFAALIYLVTRDFVSVSVVIVAAVLLGIFARHQPKQLEYRVGAQGIDIGQKHFTYEHFRSFSVLPEGAFSSIVFMPLRRFAIPTTIYYAPEDEEKIVSLLSDYLPFEERDHDAIDRLMHRIRF